MTKTHLIALMALFFAVQAANANPLSVPYIRQVGDTSDNFNGSCACGATSAVMIVASYNRLPSHSMTCTYCTPIHISDYGWYVAPYSGGTPVSYNLYGFTFDIGFQGSSGCQVNPVYGAYGYIHYDDSLAKPYYVRNYFWKNGLFSKVIYNPSEAVVKNEIDKSHPVWASTNLWPDGHIVVIKGYTVGGTYIVNDPWPNGYDHCYIGNDMIYSWSQMQTGSKWIVISDPIQVNDRVKTLYNGIKVRNGPGTSFNETTTARGSGEIGTVINDSTYGCFYNSDDAMHTDYHTWVKVQWDSDGAIGWSTIGNDNSSRLGGTSGNDAWIEKISGSPGDNLPPTISYFNVPTSVAIGDPFTFSYTVSDTGGSHLNHLEVWRYWGAQPPNQWPSNSHVYPDISLSGDTSTGSFSDSIYAPSYVGTWWYGIHVVDGSGNWNDEQNSQTSGVPDLGPIQVTVVAAQPPSMPSNPNPSDGSTIPDQPLVLSWSATSHTSSYDVYINGTFKQNVTTNQWIQNMSFTPGVSQSWNIVAKGAGGSTVGPNWHFTVQQVGPPPIINCISPISGPTSGGTTVTITGTNFDIYHPFTVYFGTTWATAIGASDSEIVVSTRAHAAGTVDVTVVTIGGSSAISQVDQFTYGGVSLPNLTPYQPSGWSDKIVVTNYADFGSLIDSNPLYANDDLYIKFAVINNGAVSTGTTFSNSLYVDNILKNTYTLPFTLDSGNSLSQSGCSIGKLNAGTHTVKIVTDSTNIINENIETDNSYTKTIAINMPPDTQGPMLTITSPLNNDTVNNASLTVSGTAIDNSRGNNGISTVTINGVSADGGTASGSNVSYWSATIELSVGENLIMVVAKDTLNNSSQQQISVTYLPLSPMTVDLNHDGIPNFSDFSIFATFWQNSSCAQPNWCGGADFDHSGSVNMLDLATFARYWLEGL